MHIIREFMDCVNLNKNGTGHCLVDLAKAVCSSGMVYGIDLSDKMMNLALRLLRNEGLSSRVDLSCGDALNLPYDAGMMDAVFMSFTLELFDTVEIPVVLQECLRVLRIEGRMGHSGNVQSRTCEFNGESV